MAKATKSAYYRALKEAGATFEKHYREYTAAELEEAWDELQAQRAIRNGEAAPEVVAPPPTPEAPPKTVAPPKPDEIAELREQLASVTNTLTSLAKMVTTQQRQEERAAMGTPPPPRKQGDALDPNEHAGVTLNTHKGFEVIEVDAAGNKWLQKEVAKPAFPKARGRRVLRYNDPGVRVEEIRVGDYTEAFEVAGDASSSRPSEIKITLPSFQTGIYLAPNMPFRIHTYNGVRGFNLFDVQDFYGGVDLVPADVKTCYVSTDLCYDITSTIRAIENEYRERVLKTEKRL